MSGFGTCGVESVCVPEGQYQLTIQDGSGVASNAPGFSYRIGYGDEEATGGAFGSSATKVLGSCPNPNSTCSKAAKTKAMKMSGTIVAAANKSGAGAKSMMYPVFIIGIAVAVNFMMAVMSF